MYCKLAFSIVNGKNIRIQALRGVAIIAVVMIHTCPGGMSQVIFRPFINFAVALFIFLSGYLTTIDNPDWKSICCKRIGRVIIPYTIWTVIYTLPCFSVVTLLKNLITSHAAATLYYVFVYIQFVLLTPIIGALCKSKNRWIGWIITPLSFIFFRYPDVFSDLSYNRYISIAYGISCLGWFSFYYLGLLLGNRLLKISISNKRLLSLWALSVILQVLEGYIWLFAGESNCGTQLKFSSLLTSSLCLIVAYRFITTDRVLVVPKLLAIIGDYSFGIYLSHIIIMKGLFRTPFYSELPFVVNSILVLIISLLVVYALSRSLGHRMTRWLGLA